MLAAAVAGFLLIRRFGQSLVAGQASVALDSNRGGGPQGDSTLTHVLLSLIVIIIVARLLGAAFRRMNQPEVIGEMIAGIMLGPSLLGRVAPGLSVHLFPAMVLPFLSVISQLGVILYMFLVGLELDTALLRERTGTSFAIAQASIVAPFLLGASLALWIYPALSTSDVPFTEFALFMGVAMSVTAFPVLARILTDRRMQKSHIGAMALACAAAGDVMAWCLLAFVVSVARAQPGHAAITMVLTVVFILFVFFLARPVFLWLSQRHPPGSQATRDTIVIVCVALLLGALATERIGIHALFGAFLIGVVIPYDSVLARDVRKKFEDSIVLLLLPAFFAYSGLRTQIGLVHGLRDWIVCISIVAVASAGKFGGSFIAAGLAGLNRRQSASLGILMNTRGLMELIVLNIGLDLGVISPALFAMLVLMAIVTTVATTPLMQAFSSPADFSPEEET
jgi:Kef-type K+ transport system membrane component KefB